MNTAVKNHIGTSTKGIVMGLASSQARLLNLTSRMHQIEYGAAKLEAQKLQMANESRRVYQEYQNALEQTKIQHKTLTSDGAVTFVDVSYADLCLGGLSEQYRLVSVDDGKLVVPAEIKYAYDKATDASDFASKLTNYNPSDPDPSAVPQKVKENTNFSISMGQAKETTINASKPITVTINNANFSGSNYQYEISTNSGSNSSEVTFRYLANGRLVIEGDNLSITASSGQADDIILCGDNNNVNTGDGNDIIRVGYARDSLAWHKYVKNNTINAGAGDDYIQVQGYHNRIDVGSGENVTLNVDYSSNYGLSTTQYSTLDNRIDWIMQNQYGDCQTLSFLDSLLRQKEYNYEDYFEITGNDNSGYDVLFKKSNSSCISGQNQDISSYNGHIKIHVDPSSDPNLATGDKDIAIIERALETYLVSKGFTYEGGNTNLPEIEWEQYTYIAELVLGNAQYINPALTESRFNALYQAYTNGTISNFEVFTQKTDNPNLGIVATHAYSVLNATPTTITVVNPWDTKDHITLSREDFFKYFTNALDFGYGKNEIKNTVSGIYSSANDETDFINNNSLLAINSLETMTPEEKNEYYINLYNAINEAGGCVDIPSEMVNNKTYLSNLINSGFAYLKEFDKKKGEWVDTSVATNTSLQEVNDESGLRKAEAKYEADMRRIDMKDRKYDYDLAALDNERNAIKNEMDTLKTVAKDNVDRTFKLFG